MPPPSPQRCGIWKKARCWSKGPCPLFRPAMAELEIHHEGDGALDRRGQQVGLLAAMIAVALGVVTIASHREHTAGVLLKAEANDRWSFYQSKRIKFHSLELGADLLGV